MWFANMLGGLNICPVSTRTFAVFLLAYATGLVLVISMHQIRYVLHPEPLSRHAAFRKHVRINSSSQTGLQDDPKSDAKLQFASQFIDSLRYGNEGRRYKLLLYWNRFFLAEDFRFGFGRSPFVVARCPVDTCFVTKDRSLVGVADAVLTHGPVVEPLPPKPKANQRYVYVQGEPHWEISSDLLPSLTDYYNLTMTYRLDSDVRLPYALINHDAKAARIKRRQQIDISTKSRSVVWVVSHCDTPSKREDYVKELAKYIDVDIYGACGNLQCSKKNNPECREMFERKYYFYLSFENDVCKDYASEKLYHPLRYNIVPIVYGGANYTSDTPPHSVINVMEHPDPKRLAAYLKHLIRDKSAYTEYFRWKNKGYAIEMDRRSVMASAMCKLCEVLHDDSYRYKDYTNIWKWWVEGSCDSKAMTKIQQQW